MKYKYNFIININSQKKGRGYIVLRRDKRAWARRFSYTWHRENNKIKYFNTIEDAIPINCDKYKDLSGYECIGDVE